VVIPSLIFFLFLFLFFLTGNLSEAGPVHALIFVGQTLNSCKALIPQGLGEAGPVHALIFVGQTLNSCKALIPQGLGKALTSLSGVAPKNCLSSKGFEH
jgi:hypothetical protein